MEEIMNAIEMLLFALAIVLFFSTLLIPSKKITERLTVRDVLSLVILIGVGVCDFILHH